jgi:hypothetical protein
MRTVGWVSWRRPQCPKWLHAPTTCAHDAERTTIVERALVLSATESLFITRRGDFSTHAPEDSLAPKRCAPTATRRRVGLAREGHRQSAMSVPKYHQLFNSVLEAMRWLGGSPKAFSCELWQITCIGGIFPVW